MTQKQEQYRKAVEAKEPHPLFGKTECYFIEYHSYQIKQTVQVEATSEQSARCIFYSRFPIYYIIDKVQTSKDIAEEISDKLMVIVNEQFNKK